MSPTRRWWIIGGLILGLLIVVSLATWWIEEPLRSYAEKTVNERLPNFNVKIGALQLHPFTLTLGLEDVVVRQEAHAEPPWAIIPSLKAVMSLLPLLMGKVGVDLYIETPSFAATREQIDAVIHTPVKEEVKEQAVAWQDAIEAMLPIRISLYLSNGKATYAPSPTVKAIEVQELEVTAENITNRQRADEYPTKLIIKVRVFDHSQVNLDGHADFLAKPSGRIDAQLKIEHLTLEGLMPILEHYNIHIRQGVVDLEGQLKHSGRTTVAAIHQLLIEDVRADYVHMAETKHKEVRQVKKGAQKVKEVHQDPSIVLKVEHGKILHCDIGFVNRATSPDYRVFLNDMNLEIDNYSNRPEEGMGAMKLTGKFMGAGPTTVAAAFRPEKPKPDFDMHVRLVKTPVENLNKLLHAYGRIESKGGTFAVFSDLFVKDGRIQGYVKPFLKDVQVYDPEQDQDKATTKKLFEAVVNEVLDLFKNPQTGQVATETDVSGAVENPKADTWEVVGKLIQNAFFKAILPGFEKAHMV